MMVRLKQSIIAMSLSAILLVGLASCRVVDVLYPLPTAAFTPTSPAVSPHQETTLQALALLPAFQDDVKDLKGIPRYDLQFEIDFAQASFRGELMLQYTNLENTDLDRLYFRLFPNGGKSYGDGSLQVSGVREGEKELQWKLSMQDTVLKVILDQPLHPGDAVALRMDFAGRVPDSFGVTGYGIYNRSQGVMALANAYPILAVYDDEGWNLDPVSMIGDSVYSDSAFYTVRVTVPEDLTLIASGREIDRQVQPGGQKRLLYVTGPVRDYFMILSPAFKRLSRTVDGTSIRAYYVPDHRQGGNYALQVASHSLRVFNEHFGPYPYQTLDVVEAPMRYAAGVEYPGVILLRSDMYDLQSRMSFSVVTAHEVAHQWWYNLVGSDVIDEPWLDEALTTYSSALYFEEIRGSDEYQEMVDYFQRSYQEARDQGLDDLITQGLFHFESTSSGRRAYSPIVYNKGALFFKSVREEIGDEAFFEALTQYYRANRYQIGEPHELLSAFEESASRELDGLYQTWLYSAE